MKTTSAEPEKKIKITTFISNILEQDIAHGNPATTLIQ